jgi:phosphoketolase
MPPTIDASISPFGVARSTVKGEPLSADELSRTNSYMQASLYLCLGMLYLRNNPLLKEPLKLEHLKARLLGHWGSDSGQVFTYVHFNRLINKYGLDAIFISGPGEWTRNCTAAFASDTSRPRRARCSLPVLPRGRLLRGLPRHHRGRERDA